MKWTVRGMLTGSLLLVTSALWAQQFPPQQPPPQQQPPRQPVPQQPSQRQLPEQPPQASPDQPVPPQRPASPQQPRGQQPQPMPNQQVQPRQDVVATVNGEPITRTELDTSVREQARGQQLDPQAAERLRKQALNRLIESRLIEEYVIEEGPDVESEEVESVINRIKQQLADQNVDFRQFLAMQGYTEKNFSKRIEGSLAWQKYQQQQMNPEKLQAFFKENQDHFQTETFEEAQQQVVQAYAESLWRAIVRRMQPDAKIQVAEPPAAATPEPTQPAMPAPQR